MTYSTQGIVLKKIASGEADAMVVIYTRDFGKLYCRAQGVKKENAKLKGHIESLSLSAIQFVWGGLGERLTYAQLLQSWPRIRSEFDRFAAALSMAELVDRHCLASQPDISIWELLFTSLAALNHESAPNVSSVVNEFEKDFLRALGYNGAKDMSILGESVQTHARWYMIERAE